MKRRSKASSKSAKARPNKSSKLPRRPRQRPLAKSGSAPSAPEPEVAQLKQDLHIALEQQAATSEALRIIASSPSELQPVFDALLANATRLCEASYGTLWLHENDGQMRIAALHGRLPGSFRGQWRVGTLFRPSPAVPTARVFQTRKPVQVVDLKEDAAYLARDPLAVASVEVGGIRSLIAIPVLKDRTIVGALTIYRREVRPFTEKHIQLVTNFAAQAVIAIENTRLLRELRESLQQQTATADVLKVISRSAFDLKVVLDALLRSAGRLCEADMGVIARRQDDRFYRTVSYGLPDDLTALIDDQPVELSRTSVSGRALLEGRVIQITDVEADPEYTHPSRGTGAFRTLVGVPMIREGVPVAVMTLARKSVRPFTDKQIELVSTFADQAAIAIENVRLFEAEQQRTRELSESLEQQTATSEVLQVISSSPGDLEPVFASMLEKAVRICDAKFGNIYRWDGEALHLMASYNTPAAFAAARGRSPNRPSLQTPAGRMIATKTLVHVPDLAAYPAYAERDPWTVSGVELAGVRTLLVVPMLKEDELVGGFTIYRQEVRPFSDKQIELVKNFAAQAVIAIENARLLNELRESLQEQTATSEVLQVISRFPGDVQPVFEAMLEKAVRICDATFGNIYRWEGNALILASSHKTPPAYAEHRRQSPMRFDQMPASLRQMVTTRSTIQVNDILVEVTDIAANPIRQAGSELGGIRTVLNVPMLKENELVGAFILSRQEVRPFTDKQIALVTNFAAQAVIAIENARLLKELRGRTEQVEAQSQELGKLNQQLEQRVADQVGEIERMGRLRRFLPPQVADLIVASGAEKQLESHRREITALFCDLRGFTGFSESADPEDVMALLREYHAAIGEIIIKYSGTLERYAGDGVMVVFNDPVPVPTPALQAVQAALDMRAAIEVLTEKWSRLGHDLGFGVGIAHGHATLGTIGFEGRFDYAAIGTVSNVASRLCDEAKPGQILISPRVLMAVEDAVTVEPVGEFELKGIRRPIAAYNVVAALRPSP